MRKSAITAAVLALSTISGVAIAEDDFSALLADLSFGDAPSLNAPETEPLTVVQRETLQDLMPVPGGMTMPETSNSAQNATTLSMPKIMEPSALEEIVVEKQAKIAPAPQVALMDPIPASEPLGAIDLDAAFALQDLPATQAKSVGHILHNQCDDGGCQSNHFETGTYTRPRQPVRLPSSTLYQYFRSHPCYTNVWDGYGIHCRSYHKHLHGECDCFSNKGCGSHGKCDECAGH